ncbi:MAG: GFA family protein [Hyphomicrobiaceae bacterium]
MKPPYDGGCQCGAVRYQVTTVPLIVYVCHCTICQTQSGSAFGMAARFPARHFRLTLGELDRFQRSGSSGHVFTNAFCRACGTRIHHATSRFPDLISLKPGTLDDASWLHPTHHVFVRSAQPWIKIPEEAEAFDTMPSDLSIFGGGPARR